MVNAASVIVSLMLAGVDVPAPIHFRDVAPEVGLGGLTAGRLCFADLNGDGRPDAIIERHRVFLNIKFDAGPGFSFVEKTDTNLPAVCDGDCLVFADLDNDGKADAILTRYLDINNEKFTDPPAPARTCWMKGTGDGSFGEPRIIEQAKRATTACIAVGDVNRDGRLDLYLGNWYKQYGKDNEAWTNDLLMQNERSGESSSFRREAMTEDREKFDEDRDVAGRPTYGAMIVDLGFKSPRMHAQLLELSYGRRANRWHSFDGMDWRDAAPTAGLDGDADRSGVYPEWLRERAKTDKRFDRENEKPYRSHGNHFDCAIGDIDSDGDFDIFLAMITHAWAGPSSDRSRFIINRLREARSDGKLIGEFVYDPRLSVDRIPSDPHDPQARKWNQGDLFCELADLDHDGRLDLILASGDYPDPPPFDERLRIFHQEVDGTFKDVTATSGVSQPGCGQISLADVDGDGDLDILVGQSFTRFTKEMIDAQPEGKPRVRLFLNERIHTNTTPDDGRCITLSLIGDPHQECNRDALGAIVRVTAHLDGDSSKPATTQLGQLIGIGGHGGKQHQFLIHVGLGKAAKADEIVITWPDARGTTTTLNDVAEGHHAISESDNRLKPTRP